MGMSVQNQRQEIYSCIREFLRTSSKYILGELIMADGEFNALARIAQQAEPEMLGTGMAGNAAIMRQIEQEYQQHLMESAENGVQPMDRNTFIRARMGG